MASLAWVIFDATYIVSLSFALRVVVAARDSAPHAAAITSLASWVMILG